MRLGKVLIGLATLAFAGALGLLVVDSLVEGEGLTAWLFALAVIGMATGLAGISWTLRWQNQKLKWLVEHQGKVAESADAISASDLSELIRVIDSRIVGFIETFQDDSHLER